MANVELAMMRLALDNLISRVNEACVSLDNLDLSGDREDITDGISQTLAALGRATAKASEARASLDSGDRRPDPRGQHGELRDSPESFDPTRGRRPKPRA